MEVLRITSTSVIVVWMAVLVAMTGAASSIGKASIREVTIFDLGTLPGHDFSIAWRVNDAGQVVGTSYDGSGRSTRAFLWENGTMKDLGTLGGDFSYGYGLNQAGQVVGVSTNGTGVQHAFLWENDTMTDVGVCDCGASSINDGGQVVGSSWLPSPAYYHAVLWENGTMKDLGTLGGYYSDARSINNAGQVVGWSLDHDGLQRAFLWANSTMTDLGTVPGDIEADAWDINDAGQMVGWSWKDYEEYHAVIWENGVARDLGSLGSNLSYAYGINGMGHVVGTSFLADRSFHAFLWKDGDMKDLGTLGYGGSNAYGINSQGLIVGSSVASSGNHHAVLWTISPSVVHNIAVTSATLSLRSAVVGTRIEINATVANLGTQLETFNVTMYSGLSLVDTKTVENLPPAASENLVFSWDTDGAAPDSYPITIEAVPLPGESDLSDNAYAAGIVVLIAAPLTVLVYATPSSADVGTDIAFTCIDGGGWPPYAFSWDFGDGTNASGNTTSHVYLAPGTKTATCTVTDSLDARANASVSIGIQDSAPPELIVPANMVVEAAGPTGAIVGYTATAHDASEGDIQPVCDPSSGSMFSIGETIVTCTATDSSGNVASGTILVFVQDSTAPVLTLPNAIVVEATGPTGTSAAFVVQATDLVDPSPTIICTPVSGSPFPLGVTVVTCAATDSWGNIAKKSFPVTVADTRPPVPTIPTDMLTEATGPDGASVTFAVDSRDAVDPSPKVDCSPPPGSIFPLGVTLVRCTATDHSGNGASMTFRIDVTDTTKPTLQLPHGIVQQAMEPSGATVVFQGTAWDMVDPNPEVVCQPESGSWFSVGSTTVTCVASDSSGNSATANFVVTIQVPETPGPRGFAVEPSVAGAAIGLVMIVASLAFTLDRRRRKRGRP